MSMERLSRQEQATLLGVAAVLAAAMLVRPVIFLLGCVLILVIGRRQIARLFPGNVMRFAGLHALLRVVPALMVAAGAAWMLFGAALPLDDLLRHILSRGWGYDYASHYGHHFVDQHWSYWIGFDWAVGTVHARTGDILVTSRIVRAVIFVAVGSAVVASVSRAHEDPLLRAAATAAILFSLLWLRLSLGRPEVLFTGLVLSALVLPRLLWLAVFVLLSPTYWLAPAYCAAALLLGRDEEPWRRRLALNLGVAAAGIAAWFVFWWIYSEGTLLRFAGLVGQVVEIHASAETPVGELMSLTQGTRNPLVLALMVGLLVAAWLWGDSSAAVARRPTIILCLLVAGFFGLPDYVRYAPIVWALLLLVMLMLASEIRVPARALPWALVPLFALVAMAIRPVQDGSSEQVLEHLRVPPGSRILTSFNPSTFFAAAANPDSVVTPIFDVASTVPPYRQLVMELSLGRIDCAVLQELAAFDYVVESTLKGDAPVCLKLLRADGPHRIWKVTVMQP